MPPRKPKPSKTQNTKRRTKAAGEGIAPKAVTGRPTKFDPSMCEQVRKFCLLGATDEQLADLLEVAVATIYNWKNEHPEFLEAINAGKEIADAQIAEALFHRARGYSHRAVKIFMPAGASEPVYADYIEHYPPDATSMIFWLSNRRKDQWRQRQEVTGKDGEALMQPMIHVTTNTPSTS
jgi:hypothetical protein